MEVMLSLEITGFEAIRAHFTCRCLEHYFTRGEDVHKMWLVTKQVAQKKKR